MPGQPTTYDPTASDYDAQYVLMSRTTGKDISEFAHMIQHMVTVLTTPLASRAGLREFGSELFDLIDKPITAGWKTRFYNAVITALARWEPRFRCTRVELEGQNAGEGWVILKLHGVYLLEGRGVTIHNMRLDFGKDAQATYER